jgi:hypothetical protein
LQNAATLKNSYESRVVGDQIQELETEYRNQKEKYETEGLKTEFEKIISPQTFVELKDQKKVNALTRKLEKLEDDFEEIKERKSVKEREAEAKQTELQKKEQIKEITKSLKKVFQISGYIPTAEEVKKTLNDKREPQWKKLTPKKQTTPFVTRISNKYYSSKKGQGFDFEDGEVVIKNDFNINEVLGEIASLLRRRRVFLRNFYLGENNNLPENVSRIIQTLEKADSIISKVESNPDTHEAFKMMFGDLLQKKSNKETRGILENKRKISKNLTTLIERELKRKQHG